jgi:hypothetical protein
MKIDPSTAFAQQLNEHLDRRARGPLLTLDPSSINSGLATGHYEFDQVRGFNVGQANLDKDLGNEWGDNLHSRQLAFALGKLISARRADLQRFKPSAGGVSRVEAGASGCRYALAEEGLEALTGSAILAKDVERLLEDAPQDWPLKSACEGILRSTEDLRNVLGQATAPLEKNHDHDSHDHGGGAIVVDVDEAIHGMYAPISYAVQAMKGGGRK